MKNAATNVCAASSSRNSLTYLRAKPQSLSIEKIVPKFNSALKRQCDLQVRNSPKRVVKRLLRSLSKRAQKLASNFSPCRCATFRSPLPKSFCESPPPKSLCKSGEGIEGELCEVFKYLDADGDGKISWVELQSALSCVGEEVGENELQEIIKQVDSDGNGCIDVDGFIRLNCEERGEEETEKELAAAFRMFEGSSKGITPVGLQRMMCRLGVENCASLEQCAFIISQVDLDGDGVVSFNEFKQMMTGVVH
ncbi:calmodulin-like protein 2 [Cryptomeria japonica]|uniref:calmodulin-like protein 2 n=1 Tax=Cryptomeria japonica TaxID=3369 RepID=UPI0025AC9F7B|nr:calmodulin-like protein 2 [Cryptomeria japonica]